MSFARAQSSSFSPAQESSFLFAAFFLSGFEFHRPLLMEVITEHVFTIRGLFWLGPANVIQGPRFLGRGSKVGQCFSATFLITSSTAWSTSLLLPGTC